MGKEEKFGNITDLKSIVSKDINDLALLIENKRKGVNGYVLLQLGVDAIEKCSCSKCGMELTELTVSKDSTGFYIVDDKLGLCCIECYTGG